VLNGVKLMQRGRLEAAQREFVIAIEHDPDCATAHRGMALIHGMNQDFPGAFSEIHLAIRHTAPDDLRGPVHMILSDCCKKRPPSPLVSREMKEIPYSTRSFIVHFLNEYFLLGVSYKNGYGFQDKVDAIYASLATSRAFAEEAVTKFYYARELGGISPETVYARNLAFVEGLSRAEGAALLVRELEVEDFLIHGPKDKDEGVDLEPLEKELAGNPLKKEIMAVLDFGFEGFAMFPDGLFHPDKSLLRMHYAAALADILKRTGNRPGGISDRFRLSPFKDVSISSPQLKAIACCVETGILDTKNGEFRPRDPLTGLEALKGISRLRDLLRNNK
jgi:hypothetical protein